jgi:hypothetical protein
MRHLRITIMDTLLLLAALLLVACTTAPPAPEKEARKTPYTQAELEAIYAQTARELGKLDFKVSVGIGASGDGTPGNRVQVSVTDREWFESELQRVGARLPEGVELIVVEGGSTARDKELVLTPPVPGLVFPRQKPTEGFRESMLAELIGTLWLDPDGGCLRVRSLYGGEDLLVVWKPEFTLREQDGPLEVLDAEGEIAARVGEEVYLAGGYVTVRDEWVLQQIPPACRGATFVAGYPVRPNLRHDAGLFDLDVRALPEQTLLFLRAKPALEEQALETSTLSGTLVAYRERRCLQLQNTGGMDGATLVWPSDWSLRVEGEKATLLDGAGQVVARLGDEVRLRARVVPHTMDAPVYRQLIEELPGDCVGATWLVEGK